MSKDPADAGRRRARIVILGGGFGGAYGARKLWSMRRRVDAEVLLIDRHNYFIFTPFLVEAGTGSLEPRHAVVPIRDVARGSTFRMAEVLGVDADRRLVTTRLVGAEQDEQIEFDHLLIALGSVTRLPEVPGLRANGYEMKSLADAVALRDHAIRLLEQANATDDPAARRRLLHWVVVGGNFTGVEVAGEFDMLLRQGSRRYPRVDASECQVTLVELGDRLLAPLGTSLSDFAARHLRRRGLDLRFGVTVSQVDRDRVVLSTGEALPVSTVIWCAGVEPNPLIKRLPVPVDDRGYILCDPDLRVRGYERIWAIGDGAVNRDASGRAYPATAQHAVGQGIHAARNLVAALTGQPTTPCELKHRGSLAALGCRTGVARVFGIKLSGFLAWWLWRSVYLAKMPRLARKIRIAMDWTIDLFFSRDYVQLGVHRNRPSEREATGGGVS